MGGLFYGCANEDDVQIDVQMCQYADMQMPVNWLVLESSYIKKICTSAYPHICALSSFAH